MATDNSKELEGFTQTRPFAEILDHLRKPLVPSTGERTLSISEANDHLRAEVANGIDTRVSRMGSLALDSSTQQG